MKAYQQTVQSFLTRLREFANSRHKLFHRQLNTSLEELLLKH